MSKQTININLTESGIEQAIKELMRYKQNILKKENLLRDRVAEFLRNEAQQGFDNSIVDDVVDGAIKADVQVTIDDASGNTTIVLANGSDAVFVEFGAGVYHNGLAGSSPNPYGNKLGFTIGSYGYGRGRRQAWGYYDGQDLKITHGTPATMPMAHAVTSLLNHYPEIAKEVFG